MRHIFQRMFHSLRVSFVILVVFFSTASHGDLTTFEFRGTVDYATPKITRAISPGERLSGSYTFDTNTSGDGIYLEPFSSARIRIDSFQWKLETPTTLLPNSIAITNNAPFDIYNPQIIPDGPRIIRYDPKVFNITVWDDSGSMLNNSSLSSTPPDISSIPEDNRYWQFQFENGEWVGGTLTSLRFGGSVPSPEPSFDCHDLGKNGILNSGLNACSLNVGDILLSVDPYWDGAYGQSLRMFAGTYWLHAAIYIGDGTIAHATGEHPNAPEDDVKIDTFKYQQQENLGWGKKSLLDWAVIRPNTTSSNKRAAASYAEDKANQTNPDILYNNEFFNPLNREREDAFYCSGLAWKAHQKQGVDLEPKLEDLLDIGFSVFTVVQDLYLVTPDDLYYSSFPALNKSKLVTQKLNSTSAALRRARFKIFSPADLLLVDESGKRTGYDPTTGISYSEIPGTYYTGHDAEHETITVTDLNRDMTLRVVGNDTGEYTLEALNLEQENIKQTIVNRNTALGQIDIYKINKQGAHTLSLEVSIDIKPGSDSNCFNINGHGVIPVAILGNENFHVNEVDYETLSFGGLTVRVRGNKGPLCSNEYSNDDEYLDLVCHFEDDASAWVSGDDNATLTGNLLDGTPIVGTDSICIVP